MLELNHQFRIVDVHARLNAVGGGPVRERTVSAEDLEREMHQAGVVRTVVFPGALPDGEGYMRANNAVARAAAERDFVAFARICGPVDASGGAGARLRRLAGRKEHHTGPNDVEQYAYNDRYHGFKLDPGVDGLPDGETLDMLEEVDLPVLVHGGERFPPDRVADTLLDRSFPVVLAHFGGHPLDRELMETAIDLLDEHERLYLDTSAVRYRAQLERAIVENPHQVVFGTGAPATHPDVAVMEILTLDVPADAMRRVFSKNAARVVDALAPEDQS